MLTVASNYFLISWWDLIKFAPKCCICKDREQHAYALFCDHSSNPEWRPILVFGDMISLLLRAVFLHQNMINIVSLADTGSVICKIGDIAIKEN